MAHFTKWYQSFNGAWELDCDSRTQLHQKT